MSLPIDPFIDLPIKEPKSPWAEHFYVTKHPFFRLGFPDQRSHSGRKYLAFYSLYFISS